MNALAASYEEQGLSANEQSDDDEIGGVGANNFTPSYEVSCESIVGGTVFAGKSVETRAAPPRDTLDLSKAFLDSAASHHQVVKESNLTHVW